MFITDGVTRYDMIPSQHAPGHVYTIELRGNRFIRVETHGAHWKASLWERTNCFGGCDIIENLTKTNSRKLIMRRDRSFVARQSVRKWGVK